MFLIGRVKYSDMCQCLFVLHKSDVDCSGFDCRLLVAFMFYSNLGSHFDCHVLQ